MMAEFHSHPAAVTFRLERERTLGMWFVISMTFVSIASQSPGTELFLHPLLYDHRHGSAGR
jgi:hypothetical protein